MDMLLGASLPVGTVTYVSCGHAETWGVGPRSAAAVRAGVDRPGQRPPGAALVPGHERGGADGGAVAGDGSAGRLLPALPHRAAAGRARGGSGGPARDR